MLTAVVLTLLLAPTQSPPAVLSGRVVDTTGASIPKATVFVDAEGAPARSTSTSQAGEFEIDLHPGPCWIRVAAPGFKDLPLQAVLVEGRNHREYVMSLKVLMERVEVRAQSDYREGASASATRTFTPLIDIPQSITVIRRELMQDQLMSGIGDVMRYTPGIQIHQGENNRDQVIIRGNSSSADFFANGVRDDVQYYRDLYNLDRVEALKGPNAMIFGRGGGGGVINRVTKEADFTPRREVVGQGGSHEHKRLAFDFGGPLSDRLAVRLNAMYEDSASFRSGVRLQRFGVNPTLTWTRGSSTRITAGYEHLEDRRVADRGVTSFGGAPADVDPSTFYGNPTDSRVRADVDIASAAAEHKSGKLTVRSRVTLGAYDRFYQNYVPGAVSPDKSLVALTAYNNSTRRTNLFSQTDFVYTLPREKTSHTLLAGIELGRQSTSNFRNTGYFGDRTTSVMVPYSAPTIATPVTFRQSASDANNRVRTTVAAGYVQGQLGFSSKVQIVAGLRFDRFDLDYSNLRDGGALGRTDDLVSPRAGVVVKLRPTLALYSSHSVSYLPSSGDQFSALTAVTEQVRPEKFLNYELGVKWDPRPGLALTGAIYRLDRTNTRATDPVDPTRIVQTGRQRTRGFEIGVIGALTSTWRVAGGYSSQDAVVTSATAAARLGARVAQVPRDTLSLWNHKQFGRLGLGVGALYRDEMFATIDNTVRLPGYTRLDLALFWSLRRDWRLQANLENAFGRKYWMNADTNTNISPGPGRSLRLALTLRL